MYCSRVSIKESWRVLKLCFISLNLGNTLLLDNTVTISYHYLVCLHRRYQLQIQVTGTISDLALLILQDSYIEFKSET